MRIILLASVALLVAGPPAGAAEVDDATAVAMARPRESIIDKGLPDATVAALLKPVDAFYGFWNNGSPALLEQAIGPGFVDHTLPPGRPQGPAGPAAASKAFLAAVPDIRVAVVQRLVAGDRVVSHLRFTGRFTGSFMGRHGAGQPVDFVATDILRVANGRILDNWHIEDNLAFLQQTGLLPKPGD